MILEIHPHVGIGALKLGASIGDLRRMIGGPYTTTRKTPEAASATDTFEPLGIRVHYGSDGTCNGIEVSPPTRPHFMGRELMALPYRKVREWLSTLDPEMQSDEAGLISLELGLGVSAPKARENPAATAESVLVFKSGFEH